MSRLIIYYNDVDIDARDISFNEIIDGINNISFSLDGIQNELFSTWNDKYDEEIKVYLGSLYLGVGYIQSMIFNDDSASFTAMGLLTKLSWKLIQDTEGKYLVSDGKVLSVPGAGSIAKEILVVESSQNEKPKMIDDGTPWDDDEFNSDSNFPYYVEVSDATAGDTEITRYASELIEDDDATGTSGTLSSTYSEDSSYWTSEIETIAGNDMRQRVKVLYSLQGIISYDSHIKSCILNFLGLVEWSGGVGQPSDLNVKIYWSKDGTENTYELFTEYNGGGAGDPDHIIYTIKAELPIDADNDTFFQNNGTSYTSGYIIIEFDYDGVTLGKDSYVRIDYTELEITYDSEDYEPFSQKISDTQQLAESFDFSYLKCYDDSDVADNFDFSGKGIAVGDLVAVAADADSVIKEIFTNTGLAYEVNDGVDIAKGFAQRYKGGTPKLDIFKEFCNAFNFIYWVSRTTPKVIAIKEEDIDAATYTYDENNSPPSTVGNIDAPNNLFGWVTVRYGGGGTVRTQASTPIDNPKEHFIDAPSITSRPAAAALALEKANYHSTNHYSIECTWNYEPDEIPQVGIKYNVVTKNGLGATTTLTNQICRRVTFAQDGTQNPAIISAYFGSASTPWDEKRGKVLGQLQSDRRLDRALDYEGRTVTTITNITPNTFTLPLSKIGSIVSLQYTDGLELNDVGSYLINSYHEVHEENFPLTGWNTGDEPTTAMAGDVFTITAPFSYYMNGRKVSVLSDATVNLSGEAAASTIFLYINQSGVLIASTTAWNFDDGHVFVDIVYKTPDSSYYLMYEKHRMMPHETHQRDHETFGPQWKKSTFVPTVFSTYINTTEGEYYDEDIEHIIAAGTPRTWRVVYRNATLQWLLDTATTTWKKDNGSLVYYDNAGTLTTVSNNDYCCYYLTLTNGEDKVPASIMGQYSYNKVIEAYADPLPTLTPFMTEWIMCYRVIVNGNGTVEDVIKLDSFNNAGSAGGTAISHQGLADRLVTGAHNDDNIAVDYTTFSEQGDLYAEGVEDVHAAFDYIDGRKYFPSDGSRAMTGDLDMGSSDISLAGGGLYSTTTIPIGINGATPDINIKDGELELTNSKLDMQSHKIENLLAGSAALDAINKTQFDTKPDNLVDLGDVVGTPDLNFVPIYKTATSKFTLGLLDGSVLDIDGSQVQDNGSYTYFNNGTTTEGTLANIDDIILPEDGSRAMDAGYSPTIAQHIATKAYVDLHINDVLDAHNASAISVVATGFSGNLAITDTDVQTALASLDAIELISSFDHGDLLGLASAQGDHTYYLTIDGSRAMTGDLDMGSADIVLNGGGIYATTSLIFGISPATSIMSYSASGLNMLSNSLYGLPAATATGQAVRYDEFNSHTGDSTKHFTEGSIDHNNLLNVGIDSHAVIDAHIDDLTTNPHDVTAADISALPLDGGESMTGDLDMGTSDILLNGGGIFATTSLSFRISPAISIFNYDTDGINIESGKSLAFVDGGEINKIQLSSGSFSDVDDELMTAAAISDYVLANVGTTDHTALSNIGTNSHATIDSHIAASTIHYLQSAITTTGIITSGEWRGTSIADAYIDNSITLDNLTQITTRSHTALSDIGTNAHSIIDTHLANSSNPHSVTASQASALPIDGGTLTGNLIVDNASGGGGSGVKILAATNTSADLNLWSGSDSWSIRAQDNVSSGSLYFEFGGSAVAYLKQNGSLIAGGLGLDGFLGVITTSIKDEDDMASDSASALATQQSIKAYVDANASAPYDYITYHQISVDNGASKEIPSSSLWRNGGVYFPASDNNARAQWFFPEIPAHASGTFSLEVYYFSISTVLTYSGVWNISAYSLTEAASSNNILNGSTAYDLASTGQTRQKKTIPLTGVAAGDIVNVSFASDASNASYVYIPYMRIVWT